MSLRTVIGFILVLVGGAITVYGIGGAVMQLAELYQEALTDPLGQPDNAEKIASANMMRSVVIGLFGILPLIVGSVLLKIGMYQRIRRKLQARNKVTG